MSKIISNKCQRQTEGNIEGLRETCFAIPPNSKLEKTEKTFVLHQQAHKFAVVSSSTTWSCARRLLEQVVVSTKILMKIKITWYPLILANSQTHAIIDFLKLADTRLVNVLTADFPMTNLHSTIHDYLFTKILMTIKILIKKILKY